MELCIRQVFFLCQNSERCERLYHDCCYLMVPDLIHCQGAVLHQSVNSMTLDLFLIHRGLSRMP